MHSMEDLAQVLGAQIHHEQSAEFYAKKAETIIADTMNVADASAAGAVASLAVYHQLAAEARRGELERMSDDR